MTAAKKAVLRKCSFLSNPAIPDCYCQKSPDMITLIWGLYTRVRTFPGNARGKDCRPVRRGLRGRRSRRGLGGRRGRRLNSGPEGNRKPSMLQLVDRRRWRHRLMILFHDQIRRQVKRSRQPDIRGRRADLYGILPTLGYP